VYVFTDGARPVTVFSDEATFQINGNVNRHNCRFWSDANLHWIDETRTQYPQKLNVWAGILMANNALISPFFIEGNLTAAKYEDMLRHEIVPTLLTPQLLTPQLLTPQLLTPQLSKYAMTAAHEVCAAREPIGVAEKRQQ